MSGVSDVSDVSGKASAVYACPRNHAQSSRQLIEHAICEIDMAPSVSSSSSTEKYYSKRTENVPLLRVEEAREPGDLTPS